nr:dnaJ homolog subfamily C member 14 [Labrus bergylta]XP_020498133.1 dnaJ homolog subfamily C member 14 [Labrus bergylta]XP_020498134.1 dnaJ homolog subfamily C member 14 [Labrus bergylta]XP_020498135.1 dnaJ homolog subfamily C member 14 [Labrus bergylta]XP_029134839.1 dnaJ homolog subfamily C member 14 [Labrus bergylta]XP_029134840.1 dnaJ homolog subfamily C member 14 [Labrus bergylta]
MEKEAALQEVGGVMDAEEEIPDGGSTSGTNSSQCEARDDDLEQEDKTAYLKSQDTSNAATPDDAGVAEAEYCGSTEAKEDTEEASDGFDHDSSADHENLHVINQEEDEAAKEQHMNGESGWRTGSGRRFKLRSTGSFSEQSSQSAFSSFQRERVMSGGGRHKQTRRRNHHHHQQSRARRRTSNQLFLAFKDMLSEFVSFWCISCVHMMIEIIVTLTHNCGVGVETGGIKLYNFGQQLVGKMTDIAGMKADASRFVKWTTSTGTDMADKIVRSANRVKTAALSCMRLFYVLFILSSQWAKGVFVRLTGERGKRYWTALQESRFWKRVLSLLERVRSRFRRDGHVPLSSPESPGRAGRSQPGQELERLLALAEVPEDELDPFTVLGVEVHATEAELKKAYRQLAVQVHPDKNKHPRAGEAFKVLRAAWDIVSNPETRREYELKRMAATELSKSMNEFLTKLQDDLKEAMNTMMCTKCEGKHKRFEMDREPAEARFCAECNHCHSAEEGDLWAESSMLGLRITYFAFMDGKVYDITEWAGCQRISISPDTHRVPYHISFGSKNNSSSTRNRAPSEPSPGPTNPADLQDFFNRIFKGAPPNDMAANGGFFPSGPPHHQPPGAGAPPFSPPFSPPPGPTNFFMPGSQRPESSETWAESGKPPRRRKKVRKPFQR